MHDVVVLNRDMTSHIPDVLENVKQKTLVKPVEEQIFPIEYLVLEAST